MTIKKSELKKLIHEAINESINEGIFDRFKKKATDITATEEESNIKVKKPWDEKDVEKFLADASTFPYDHDYIKIRLQLETPEKIYKELFARLNNKYPWKEYIYVGIKKPEFLIKKWILDNEKEHKHELYNEFGISNYKDIAKLEQDIKEYQN